MKRTGHLLCALGMIGNILGCACANPLSNALMKTAYIFLQYISAAISCVAFWLPSEQLILAFIVYFYGVFSHKWQPTTVGENGRHD